MHTGEVYPELRDPRSLLEALDLLIREGLIRPQEVLVRLIGAGAGLHSEAFRGWLASRAIAGSVSVEPRLNHRACIAESLSADVLILLQCSSLVRQQLPAKAFEYLRAGRPVLTIAPADSATAEFFNSADVGWVLDADDAGGLQRAVREIVSRFRGGSLQVPVPRASSFERRHLARSLAGIFTDLLLPARPSAGSAFPQSETASSTMLEDVMVRRSTKTESGPGG
jgi:glycosyltransferase involved in cell wall biosynthesis